MISLFLLNLNPIRFTDDIITNLTNEQGGGGDHDLTQLWIKKQFFISNGF